MNSDLGAEQLDNSGQVRVWDLFVRVFHWSLVVGFVVAYFSAEILDEVHEWSGYAVLALVILRIV